MKKGDVVTIKDSSYSFMIVDDSLEHHAGEVQKERQIIIAVDCDLPAYGGYYSGTSRQRNNTIVRGQLSGRITFVQQRFCRLIAPTHKVMVDLKQEGPIIFLSGNIVEISDELYKQIKK